VLGAAPSGPGVLHITADSFSPARGSSAQTRSSLLRGSSHDAFLCWWWRHSTCGDEPSPPWILFVCQTPEQREAFVAAADRELTGHRWHPSAGPERHDYVGRRRVLFALEHDAHDGRVDAWQLPAFPAGHPARDVSVRRRRLVIPATTDEHAPSATAL